MRARPLPTSFLLALVLAAPHAAALDKQGSAHEGSVAGADSGLGLDGTASIGASIYNPTYAARPDNSGLALFCYALHADLDLAGRRLSVPLDLNMFTDRKRTGAGKIAPSEIDLIGGVTTTWALGPGAIEGGVRVEHDRPADRTGYTQTYVDARARFLYSVAAVRPGVGRLLRGGDISGHLTLGVFAYNPTYAARPDNSGLALMRYGGHWEISAFDRHVAVGLDATMFSDRKRPNPFGPTELDVTPEIVGRLEPLDRGGLMQTSVYALLGFSFHVFSYDPSERKR